MNVSYEKKTRMPSIIFKNDYVNSFNTPFSEDLGAFFSCTALPRQCDILVVFISCIQIVFELSCKLFSSKNTTVPMYVTHITRFFCVNTSTYLDNKITFDHNFWLSTQCFIKHYVLCCNFGESLGHKQFMFSS